MKAPDHWWRERDWRAAVLAPAAALYGAGARLRRAFVRPAHVPIPVLCVGNPTAGGAGKTPVVQALVRRLAARGRRPGILLRGHGGRLAGPLRIDPAAHDAAAVGDEALLHARVAPTWVARDRAAGARMAAASEAVDCLVLDDGFQNPMLAKDVALLVVDGTVGLGNGRVFPAGPLREPLDQALARADALVLVGEDRTGLAARLPATLPILHAALVPDPPQALRDAPALIAFAGIGRPEKFFESLRALGLSPLECLAFADHHPYGAADIDRLTRLATERGLVTTEKDAVRLPAAARRGALADLLTLPVSIAFEDGTAVDRLLDRLVDGTLAPQEDRP